MSSLKHWLIMVSLTEIWFHSFYCWRVWGGGRGTCVRSPGVLTTNIKHVSLSSPELKVQLNFSEHRSSFFFTSSPELFGQIQSNFRRYMAEILPIRRKTLFNQSINQTWHKASLGKRDSSSLEGSCPFPREHDNKNILTAVKNILVRKHWTNFSQIWHKTFWGEGNSS